MRTIRVRLLLFAQYRDLAGTGERDIELREGATAAELVAGLRQSPALSALPQRPALAVNQEYASLDAVLRDGDEVALLPPVAGG
ncbi:MAG: molybdopterin converting factor subunit 1 [Longimicrobiales bacterium]